MRRILLAIAISLATACRGSDEPGPAAPQGNAERGRVLVQTYGCGTCHTVPGIPGARARIGPPLRGIADRGYIAGVLPNTEADMVRWLQDPPGVDPRTLMPNMRVTRRDAVDMTAYLVTLRAESYTSRMLRGFIERGLGRQVASPGELISKGGGE